MLVRECILVSPKNGMQIITSIVAARLTTLMILLDQIGTVAIGVVINR